MRTVRCEVERFMMKAHADISVNGGHLEDVDAIALQVAFAAGIRAGVHMATERSWDDDDPDGDSIFAIVDEAQAVIEEAADLVREMAGRN